MYDDRDDKKRPEHTVDRDEDETSVDREVGAPAERTDDETGGKATVRQE